MDKSRREAIKKGFLLFAGIAATPVIAVGQNIEEVSGEKLLYPLPPGAISLDRFIEKCTACQLCVNHCPTHVLTPALFENGIQGFMQPILKYDVHKFCEFECKICSDVCPNEALVKMPIEEKKLVQIGQAKLILDNCIVVKNNKACGACAEHCPTKALKMVPYKGVITQPEIVDPDLCIGCGACESICPVHKEALYIERNIVHKIAKPPLVEKQEQKEITDFGF